MDQTQRQAITDKLDDLSAYAESRAGTWQNIKNSIDEYRRDPSRMKFLLLEEAARSVAGDVRLVTAIADLDKLIKPE